MPLADRLTLPPGGVLAGDEVLVIRPGLAGAPAVPYAAPASLLGSGGLGSGAADVSKLPDAVLSSLQQVVLFDPATGAQSKVDMRDLSTFLLSPAARLHARGHAPNPMPTAKMDVLEVGATKQFGEISDAAAWANPGATINCDDGVYYTPFHCEVPNLLIQSVSGNPFRCWCDGEGGMGGGKRLAYGKGFMHLSAPAALRGLGFRNCGSVASPVDYASEAGLYAEGFAAMGDLSLYRCSFDGNGNGIFIPQANGQNIAYKETECLFAAIQSNSLSNPTASGPSHDHYITPFSAVIDGSYNYGNVNGHAIKCEAPTLVVKNCPWIASWGGRAVEAAFGGAATVTNCTLVSRGDFIPGYGNAAGNFIGYADQTNDRAASGTTMTFDGCSFLIGRGGDNGGVIFVGFGNAVSVTNSTQKWFSGGIGMGFLSYAAAVAPGGTVTGLQLGLPADGDPRILASIPAPPPVPAWAFV